jgi:hypothetical protein
MVIMIKIVALVVLGNFFILGGGLIIVDELWLHTTSPFLGPYLGTITGLISIGLGNCFIIEQFKK